MENSANSSDDRAINCLYSWARTAYKNKVKSDDIPEAFLSGCVFRAVDIWNESGEYLLQYRHAEAAVEEQLEKAIQYIYSGKHK